MLPLIDQSNLRPGVTPEGVVGQIVRAGHLIAVRAAGIFAVDVVGLRGAAAGVGAQVVTPPAWLKLMVCRPGGHPDRSSIVIVGVGGALQLQPFRPGSPQVVARAAPGLPLSVEAVRVPVPNMGISG